MSPVVAPVTRMHVVPAPRAKRVSTNVTPPIERQRLEVDGRTGESGATASTTSQEHRRKTRAVTSGMARRRNCALIEAPRAVRINLFAVAPAPEEGEDASIGQGVQRKQRAKTRWASAAQISI